jgi:hypothetical protein
MENEMTKKTDKNKSSKGKIPERPTPNVTTADGKPVVFEPKKK